MKFAAVDSKNSVPFAQLTKSEISRECRALERNGYTQCEPVNMFCHFTIVCVSSMRRRGLASHFVIMY